MKIPLNPDKKDQVWNLFSKILKVIDSRTFQQELARNGLNNIKNHQIILKIILLSIFYQLDLNYVYNKIISRPKLKKFLDIDEILSLKQIRKIYHRYDECKYLELALKTLNKMNFKEIKRIDTMILDSTSITLDLKFGGKYLSKQKLLTKDYKRVYSTNNGHYAVFKMTLAIDKKICKPLTILIHPGAPHDTTLFDDMLNELKRRKILKNGN
ncbi:transposase [Methanobrevibacter sp. TMH8]|uniref:transposase n=1 Tax=Methanobrevibacter sp. TMH8 TaxID=2848611 RepID=UPI0021068B93|nr:transposase [Methanobrevibacter sp. TMH8]MBZ9570946.1 transposase [Methanobrevibacter sp. TMH8]